MQMKMFYNSAADSTFPFILLLVSKLRHVTCWQVLAHICSLTQSHPVSPVSLVFSCMLLPVFTFCNQHLSLCSFKGTNSFCLHASQSSSLSFSFLFFNLTAILSCCLDAFLFKKKTFIDQISEILFPASSEKSVRGQLRSWKGFGVLPQGNSAGIIYSTGPVFVVLAIPYRLQ